MRIPRFDDRQEPPAAERHEREVDRPGAPTGEATEPRYEGYNGQPILVGGDGGAPVKELVDLLAEAGYETDVSRGEADVILTNSVWSALRKFRQDADVEIDELSDSADDVVVGPADWAALARATGRA